MNCHKPDSRTDDAIADPTFDIVFALCPSINLHDFFHVIAFLRRHQERQILVVALRMSLHLLNGDLSLRHCSVDLPCPTTIVLPQALHGDYVDVLSGNPVDTSHTQLQLANLLGAYPVALVSMAN